MVSYGSWASYITYVCVTERAVMFFFLRGKPFGKSDALNTLVDRRLMA